MEEEHSLCKVQTGLDVYVFGFWIFGVLIWVGLISIGVYGMILCLDSIIIGKHGGIRKACQLLLLYSGVTDTVGAGGRREGGEAMRKMLGLAREGRGNGVLLTPGSIGQ